MSPAIIDDIPPYEYPAETTEELDYADLEALDISKLNQEGGKEELAKQVLGFINKNGFFYIKGHGFSDAQIRRQYALCRAIFALPLEEKLKYQCDTAAGDFRGYKPQSTSSPKLASRDNDERYNIPKFTPEHERPHPQLIHDHWDEIKDFSLAIHNNLLLPLLRLFAHVLELDDEEFFVKRHRYEAPGLEYLRYMVYHPRSAEEDARAGNIWARGHTDYNTLTFLFHQPVAGLQVQTTASEGSWKYVRSPRDAVIVNIADALEFLSGGYLKSTVHRVVRAPEDQAGQSRLSLIYFARPEADIVLEPVKSPLLQRIGLGERSEKERFARQVTAEEWARARIAKDHRFRTGIVDAREKEIIAGVNERFYD
ncbi:putative 1-aminocyclopropane-1-carboxylate oxidase [Coniella lustricola]|uniref:Putative 1-aminocyclopropane-1-carboxylate oxidase n=1 Tax=Coniella lustricola TaxID=2025994 RepID=A0A2T3AF31_9PEZI|nr:putative 1-aminocyclopropane-1-carboxylate oxidase [Coniella lustricola]